MFCDGEEHKGRRWSSLLCEGRIRGEGPEIQLLPHLQNTWIGIGKINKSENKKLETIEPDDKLDINDIVAK